MRARVLLILAVVGASIAALIGPASAPAGAICDESQGCSPCGGPTVTIDGKNTRVDWVVC